MAERGAGKAGARPQRAARRDEKRRGGVRGTEGGVPMGVKGVRQRGARRN